jgi:hypothetical protein
VKNDKEIGEKVIAIISNRLPKGSFGTFNEVLLINSFIAFALDRLGLLAVKMAEDPEEVSELSFWNLMEFILGLAKDQASACDRLIKILEPTVKKNLEFEKIADKMEKLPGNSKLIH